jgi:SAM-dependent methyltransferase
VPVASLLLIVLALGCPAGAGGQERPDLDAPYVVTPDQVVVEMLRLARVTEQDVLYDLGSGDGRIVIAAARQFGARGVGIEIDPERVLLAADSARRSGVGERVRFVQGDIFTADIGPATVVTMYLLPGVTLRLRAKLLAELRPGTRIVSHDYGLGDWKPDKSLRVGRSTLYYWVVPARPAEGR